MYLKLSSYKQLSQKDFISQILINIFNNQNIFSKIKYFLKKEECLEIQRLLMTYTYDFQTSATQTTSTYYDEETDTILSVKKNTSKGETIYSIHRINLKTTETADIKERVDLPIPEINNEIAQIMMGKFIESDQYEYSYEQEKPRGLSFTQKQITIVKDLLLKISNSPCLVDNINRKVIIDYSFYSYLLNSQTTIKNSKEKKELLTIYFLDILLKLEKIAQADLKIIKQLQQQLLNNKNKAYLIYKQKIEAHAYQQKKEYSLQLSETINDIPTPEE